MRKICSLIFITLSFGNAFAAEAWTAATEAAEVIVPTVSIEQFAKGKSWTWGYSEVNGTNGESAAPNVFETYTVTNVNGNLVTIEMSTSHGTFQKTKPHHKFIANVKDCVENRLRRPRRSFLVEFYTRSFHPNSQGQWELVSKQHEALMFEEKFNCLQKIPAKDIRLKSEVILGAVTDLFRHDPRASHSWYVNSTDDLKGVAALKNFPGKMRYQFQLLDISSN